jgi:DNA mismatch repair protein MutS2
VNPHAVDILEYSQLIGFLSRYTDSELTRRKILNLEPSTNCKWIVQQSRELAEFRYLIQSGQKIPSFTAPQFALDESFKSASIKGWRLPADKIAATGELLLQVVAIRNGFLAAENIPLIKNTVSKLVALPELARIITRSISPRGDILDRASDELIRIRRSIRKHQERIRSKMDEMAASLYRKGVLQDPIVTMREGRYVLPVKAGSVRDLPGIVHDKSSSGATFFIEPNVSIHDSNALNQLEADERHEIQKILLVLTEAIGKKSDVLLENLEIVIELDCIHAKARFSEEIKANQITIESCPVIDLKECINPLLLLHRLNATSPEERAEKIIPIDITLESDQRVLVITGPNTGGKTVALKTVGLSLLMIQSGLHPVCSEFSRFGVFKDIFADIGDEQSIEQNLSTFSSHISHIVDILDKADKNSLVLLDELGAGTDPEEGSALGIAIIKELLNKQVFTIVNTHHNSIKAYAFTTPGIQNAAMEFDTQSLQPTYRILMGKIGQSNALSIAAKLGFPERILKDVKNYLSGKTNDLQKMLDVVEQRRLAAEKRIAQADNEKLRAKELRRAREDVLNKARNDAKVMLEKASQQAQSVLSELYQERDEFRKEINTLRRNAKRNVHESDFLRDASEWKQRLGNLDKSVSGLKEMVHSDSPERFSHRPVEQGDHVSVKQLGKKAKVIQKEGPDKFVVDMNGKKLRVSSKDILRVGSDDTGILDGKNLSERYHDIQVEYSESEPPPLRLNLIGKTREEALDELDRYMGKVVRCRMPQITIIHGFGTGTLQNAVVEYLKKTPQVLRARSGEPLEGGGGVTVVELDTTS